ncbi:MAG: HAD family hydrolase [Enhygromyxa sp.]
MRARLRALLLDLDGTLVDRDAALEAWLGRRAGLGPEIERLLALDRADDRSLAALARELARLRPGLAVNPGALLERIRGELPEFVRPEPGVIGALDRLRGAGLRLALVSNGGPSQRRKLAAAKLPESLFETIWISGELGHAKPAPAIFEATLRALELGPEQVMMIGDSPEQDIAGAAALGISTCWIAAQRPYPAGCPAPTMIARDFPSAVARLLD